MRKTIIKAIIGYVVLAWAVVFIVTRIIMVNLIPSGSMEGTIHTGDIVIATRYNRQDVNRYDIVVFRPVDEPDKYYIKRVIGLPGETIEIKDGEVYADGMLLDDSFLPETMRPYKEGIYEVPEDSYFMLGDNRNHSSDSRYWEHKYVSAENITAKAAFCVFPFSNIGTLTYAAESETGTPN